MRLKDCLKYLGILDPSQRSFLRELITYTENISRESVNLADEVVLLLRSVYDDAPTDEERTLLHVGIKLVQQHELALNSHFEDAEFIWSESGLQELHGKCSGLDLASKVVLDVALRKFQDGDDEAAIFLRDSLLPQLETVWDETLKEWRKEYRKREEFLGEDWLEGEHASD